MQAQSTTSAVLLAIVLVAGCGRQGGTTSPAPSSTPTHARTAPSAPSAPSVASAVTASASAAPTARPEGLQIAVTAPGNVVLRNDGDTAVRVAWELPIEKEIAGAWTSAHSMQLMTKCFDPKPADGCVTIAPHASFTPLPWTGWFGCTQCGSCRANVPAGEGRYRVVAVECDGGARHAGPPMELAGEGRFAHTPHVYAPASEPNAIWIDNESDTPVSFRTAVEVLRLDAARGAYDLVADADMALLDVCTSPRPACVTIPAHGSLHTMGHRAGCGLCTKCAASQSRAGTYLMRVSVCDSSKPLYNEVYGASFTTAPFVVGAAGSVKPER
jgi:hypothetical protein